MLCVVDDVQWADTASAEALRFAARRRRQRARRDAVRPPRGAGRWHGRRPPAACVDVGPAGARRGAGAAGGARQGLTVDGGVRDRLTAETGGNPLALCELAARSLDRDAARRARGRLPEALPTRQPGSGASVRAIALAVACPSADPRGCCSWPPCTATARSVRSSRPRARIGVRVDLDGACARRGRGPRERRRRTRLVRAPAHARGGRGHVRPTPRRRRAHEALAAALADDPDRGAWHLAPQRSAPIVARRRRCASSPAVQARAERTRPRPARWSGQRSCPPDPSPAGCSRRPLSTPGWGRDAASRRAGRAVPPPAPAIRLRAHAGSAARHGGDLGRPATARMRDPLPTRRRSSCETRRTPRCSCSRRRPRRPRSRATARSPIGSGASRSGSSCPPPTGAAGCCAPCSSDLSASRPATCGRPGGSCAMPSTGGNGSMTLRSSTGPGGRRSTSAMRRRRCGSTGGGPSVRERRAVCSRSRRSSSARRSRSSGSGAWPRPRRMGRMPSRWPARPGSWIWRPAPSRRSRTAAPRAATSIALARQATEAPAARARTRPRAVRGPRRPPRSASRTSPRGTRRRRSRMLRRVRHPAVGAAVRDRPRRGGARRRSPRRRARMVTARRPTGPA